MDAQQKLGSLCVCIAYLGKPVLTLRSRMTASMSASACCIWLFLTGATCLSGLSDVSTVADCSSCGTDAPVVVIFVSHQQGAMHSVKPTPEPSRFAAGATTA